MFNWKQNGENECQFSCHYRQQEGLYTLRLLLIASTNFSVFTLRVFNFSEFLCLHNVITNSTKVQNPHMQALDAGITPCIVSHLNSKCQGPTHIEIRIRSVEPRAVN